MLNRLWRLALKWMQRRCTHVEMKADLLEGDGPRSVGWCETCGAIRIGCGELRMPEPTWHPIAYEMRRDRLREKRDGGGR